MSSRKYILILIIAFPSIFIVQKVEANAFNENREESVSIQGIFNNSLDLRILNENQITSTESFRYYKNSLSTIQTDYRSATKKNEYETRTAQSGKAHANSPVARISLEILFGLVGNITVFGSLYASIPWWWKRKEKCDKEGISDDCGLGPSVMTLVAVPLGVITEFTTPLGVYLGGKTMGGSGSYGWTLLGHLSGVAVGFTAGYLLRNTMQSSEDGMTSTIPILSIATITQLTGAIVAYEFSSKAYDGEETTVKEAIGRFELISTPVVTITDHDIIIGTRGAF